MRREDKRAEEGWGGVEKTRERKRDGEHGAEIYNF
jgi:hypothetical protein